MSFLFVQRPLASDLIWWNLSRGRELLAGRLSPSSHLLLLDTSHEADWLSGLPFYISWIVGGEHLLAAIPFVIALFLLVFLKKRIHLVMGEGGFVITVLPLLLLAIRNDLQPNPELFDLFGLIFLWGVSRSSRTSREWIFSIFLLFVFWSNFGPRPGWGLLWLSLNVFSLRVSSTKTESKKQRKTAKAQSVECGFSRLYFFCLLSAVIGGICNPRAIFAWYDSLVRMFPSLFADPEFQKWIPSSAGLSFQNWTGGATAFAAMGVLVIVSVLANCAQPIQQDSGSQKFSIPILISLFILPLIGVLLSVSNLAVCSLWYFFVFLSLVVNFNKSEPENVGPDDRRDSFFLEQIRKWGSRSAAWRTVVHAMKSDFHGHTIHESLLMGAILSFAVIEAVGFSGEDHFGWGVASENDVRLLNLPPSDTSDSQLIGWALDSRSIGFGVWNDAGMKFVDHPQRALLGGRQKVHLQLLADLAGAHRATYMRDDGTQGGWVRKMANWEADLLLIPVAESVLHRELMKSPWRPLDLDAPIIPYGASSNPALARQALEVIQQQGFVEFGPWQPTVDVYQGHGWRIDFVELMTGKMSPTPAIRQSQVFRAMDLPMASLRALLPIRKGQVNGRLEDEFRQCQSDLVYQEWVTFGKASLFRRLVSRNLSSEKNTSLVKWMVFTELELEQASEWGDSIQSYLQGDLSAAIQSLPKGNLQGNFAAAMIWLEAGETGNSLQELDLILTGEATKALKIAALYWKEQIQQMGNG